MAGPLQSDYIVPGALASDQAGTGRCLLDGLYYEWVSGILAE